MDRTILQHLDPMQIIHPKDGSVIRWVDRIPGFRSFLNKTVNKYISIFSNLKYVGNGYSINSTNSPILYNQFLEDCQILGKKDIPEFSAQWANFISSLSLGTEKKDRIVLSSGAIDQLSKEELDFLIGHELGHIMTGHKPYHTFVELMCDPMLGISSVYLKIVRLPLLEWYRLSHYTADRMGLLCCQDINVALTTMIKMAGLPSKYYNEIDIEGFKEQAREFDELHGGAWDMIIKAFSVRSATAPWMVKRAKELIDWYNSNEYKNIIARH